LSPEPSKQNKSSALLSFFFGGLLPIIAFSVIEDHYGPVWGTVAGMAFGLGEIIFEKLRYKKVSTITWVGNLMILGLGSISIVSQNGIWFKLQPALFEAFFALLLWGSLLAKKNMLLMMAEKQGNTLPENVRPLMNGMAFRMGLFFAIHAGIATWAAFDWTTTQWAWLKGAGLTITFLLYMGFELLLIRSQAGKRKGPPSDGPSPQP
jgi:intracellular septation protein